MSNLRLSAIPMPLIVFAAVLGALFLFLAVPRIIAHDTPVDDQVIHSCVDKHGKIKIVDPQGDGGSKDKGSKDKGSKDNDGCKKKETPLDWTAIDLSGTTPNFVLKTTSSVGDSQIFDNGTFVGIGTTTDLDAQNKLGVAGRAAFDFGSQGVVRLTTPGGEPGIVVTQTTPLTDPDRFDMIHAGGYFGFGFNQDWALNAFPPIAIQKGGNVGIGTSNPTARLQVGPATAIPFGNTTTLGVMQQPGDLVGLSVRRIGADPIMQFCSDVPLCNYVTLNRTTGRIGIGSDVFGANLVLSVGKTGGRVGIGTPTPSGALHVSNDSGGASVTGHGVTIDSGDVAGNARVEIRDSQGGGVRTPYIDFSDDPSIDYDMRLRMVGAGANKVLRVEPGNNVLGAGTLQVAPPFTTGGNGVSITGSDNQGNAAIELRDHDSTGNVPYIDFTNDSGTDFDMRLRLTGDNTLNVEGGALHVADDSGGSTTAGQGVTIDAGDLQGNACIEIRDSQGSGPRTPYIDFSNDGDFDFDMRLILKGDNTLNVEGGNLVATVVAPSDERLKANIETIANPLDKVLALRGVTYNWRPDTSTDEGTHIGLVAQEVEKVLPEVVSTVYDGYKGVSYTSLIGVLVEAMKEQQTQIDALEARLAELENR